MIGWSSSILDHSCMIHLHHHSPVRCVLKQQGFMATKWAEIQPHLGWIPPGMLMLMWGEIQNVKAQPMSLLKTAPCYVVKLPQTRSIGRSTILRSFTLLPYSIPFYRLWYIPNEYWVIHPHPGPAGSLILKILVTHLRILCFMWKILEFLSPWVCQGFLEYWLQ